MLMPGSPHTARPACLRWPPEPWSSMAAATRSAQLQAACDAGLRPRPECRKNDLAVQVPQRLRSQFVALGRSITRHRCWLPVIACPARPLAVAAGGLRDAVEVRLQRR